MDGTLTARKCEGRERVMGSFTRLPTLTHLDPRFQTLFAEICSTLRIEA